MIHLGPYRFSPTDARKTLAHADDLFDLLAEGLPVPAAHAERIDAHRATALAVVGDRSAPDEERLRAVWDGWQAAAAVLRASGALGRTATGTVAHLAAGGGGVPKPLVPSVEVGFGGVVGDRQRTRRHHGRPWQALCLWSTEAVAAVARPGDDLAPGHCGENIGLTGVPWDRVRPGARLRIGTVTCELWAWALPCRTIARWFEGRQPDRIHHRHGPVSRIYAAVLEPGHIAVGDEAVLLP